MSESYDLIARVKAQVSDALSRFNDLTKGVGKSKTAMESFSHAASTAAGMLMRDMVNSLTASFGESIKLGAEVETLRKGFEALKGEVSDEVLSLDTLRAATQGTVSDTELLQAANNALALGLPTDQLNDLYRSAMTVGHAMGRTTLQAVQDLTTGIGRQSKLILDNLGILVDTKKAHEDYAAALGKTAEELTDAEKKTAFMTAAIKALNEKAETLTGTTSEAQLSQERFGAAIDNLKTSVGSLLAPLGAVAPILEGAMPLFSTFAATLIPQLVAKYGVLGLATKAWGAITVATHKLVSATFWTNPLTIAIMAIITAVTLLYTAWDQNWGGIREIVGAVTDWIMDKIGWLIDGLTKVADALQGAWNWLSNAWNSLTGSLSAGSDQIGEVTEDMEHLYDVVGQPPSTGLIESFEALDKVVKNIKLPELEEMGGLPSGRHMIQPASVGIPAQVGASQTVNLVLEGPIVNIEGSADERTAELAAEKVREELRNVLVEASSGQAPGTHKRVRVGGLLNVA